MPLEDIPNLSPRTLPVGSGFLEDQFCKGAFMFIKKSAIPWNSSEKLVSDVVVVYKCGEFGFIKINWLRTPTMKMKLCTLCATIQQRGFIYLKLWTIGPFAI